MTAIRIAIHGAAGRMGRRLVALGAADPQLTVAAALESPDNAALGRRRRHRRRRRGLGRALGGRTARAGRRGHRFLGPQSGRSDPGDLPAEQAAAGPGHDRLRARADRADPCGGERDPAALVAEHEHGGEPHDEALRTGRQGPGRQGRRRGDSRTASSFQGRLAQRHGLEVRRDHRPADGADRSRFTAAAAGRASGRTTRSASTPSASATIRASTRSSSPCSARRSN